MNVHRTWLNPPRQTDAHSDVIVRLSQHDAAAVVDALRQGSSDRDTSSVLYRVANDLDSARQTPREADEHGLSREATWHPANIAQRVTTAAIRNAARWIGPRYLVAHAIETAAAIAYSQGGDEAKRQTLEHARHKIADTAETHYPATQ